MEQTPRANRVHIGFFGRRNAGKSSLINAIAGQTVSVVSPVCGTTTDTVEKAMELLPIGAVVLIDTPGLDDVGTLGSLRVRQAKRALTHTDIAVMVIDAAAGMTPEDREILQQLEQRHIPTIQVWNKCDQATPPAENAIAVSAATGEGIRELKEELGRFYQKLPIARQSVRLFGSLLHPEDVVLLVTPIDESAPKGRMILPQVQAIREILDQTAICVVTPPFPFPVERASTPCGHRQPGIRNGSLHCAGRNSANFVFHPVRKAQGRSRSGNAGGTDAANAPGWQPHPHL